MIELEQFGNPLMDLGPAETGYSSWCQEALSDNKFYTFLEWGTVTDVSVTSHMG